MAQQQKAPKQQDPYVQRGKTLTSAVQRLRGWVGSDPSRTPELADALVSLTAHRLLGHGYASAAPDAQEAVRYAAQLLTANGPIGPYTSAGDAVRYVTAVVHLATIQVGLGLTEAAGRTLGSLHDIRDQLDESAIALRLDPSTAVWALLVEARSALAAEDVAGANASADAAVARWAESALADEPDATYLALDVERLASDARWSAGQDAEALGYLLSAKDRYDTLVGDRLGEPGRQSEAVLQRLAEPLLGLYSAVAERLIACGEADLGRRERRELIDLLRGLEKRLGETARTELTAAEAALDDESGVRTARPPVSWAPLSGAASYATAVPPPERPVDPRALDAERRRLAATWLEGNRTEAHRQEEERRAAERSEEERRLRAERAAEAARVEHEAAQRAEAERAAQLEAERAAAAEEAERQERKRRREERLEAHRLEVERREAEQREAEGRERELHEAEVRDTDPAEAERLELERLQQELADLERAEAEKADAERAEAKREEAERQEAERLEAERLEAEHQEAERQEAERQEAERQEAERQEAERLEAERQEAERQEAERQEAERQEAEQDELREALGTWDDLKAQGDRRAARAANERVVELLRPRAIADPAQFGPQLVTALEELSRARLRSGDLFGSRAPAREAKALAKTLTS